MRRLSYLFAFLILAAAVPGVLCAAQKPSETTLEITSPPNDSTVNGKQAEVAVQFLSPGSQPVTKVKVFLDGKYITERAYSRGLSEGTTSFKWDTTRSANGRHKVDIQAFCDDVYLGMASCTIYVSNSKKDIAPPRVAVTSPRDGAVVSGITPIVVEAFDNSGLEPMVNVYVDKNLRSVKNRGPYGYDWDTTGYANGPHTIEVGAEDDAKNSTPMKAVHVIVRNQTKREPIMLESSSIVMPSHAVTPAVSARSVAGRREVTRVAGSKSEYFEFGRNGISSKVASKQVAAPKSIVHAAVLKPEPGLTLMAKADTKAPEIPQCCPGNACKVVGLSWKPESGKSCSADARVYTVRLGDNLDTLAKRFDVSVSAIAKASCIDDSDTLQIGQKLKIPAATRLIPVRPIFEAAGGTLVWDPFQKRVVRAVCPQNDVTLKIGSSRAVVNKKSVRMDKAAVVNFGRTMVPETFVTGPLGMMVPGK